MRANPFPHCSRYNATAPDNRPHATLLRCSRTSRRAAPPGCRRIAQIPSAAPSRDQWQVTRLLSIRRDEHRNQLKDWKTWIDIVQLTLEMQTGQFSDCY